MNIIIYPGTENLKSPNERMFRTPLFDYNFTFMKNTDISSLQETFKEKVNEIKSIIILLDDYGFFINHNIDFILSNKTIKFYIHENDIHYLYGRRLSIAKRYKNLRDKLIDNNHIFILAYYWYHYKKIYNINHNNVICFPRFVLNKNILYVNPNPNMKILLSGALSSAYPMRRYLKNLNNPNVEILCKSQVIRGDDYISYLNTYLCAFSCCSNNNTPYIVNKFFEIPAAGCLLLAYDEYVQNALKEIGFIDMVNYISCDKHNIVKKIEYICNEDNLEEINKIRLNGYQLVTHNHTIKNRYDLLEQIVN